MTSKGMNYKSLEEYLALPWNYSVEHWEDSGGYYAAKLVELPACIADGQTPEEALTSLKEVMHLYFESCIQHGDPIPEPLRPSDFKGQISYRTTKEKHYRLAIEAERRRKSINSLIDDAVERFFG